MNDKPADAAAMRVINDAVAMTEEVSAALEMDPTSATRSMGSVLVDLERKYASISASAAAISARDVEEFARSELTLARKDLESWWIIPDMRDTQPSISALLATYVERVRALMLVRAAVAPAARRGFR